MEHILDLQLQSSVAKLLATENITVTHNSSLTTAYFDVNNRTLGLPVWKNVGKVVYDMLLGHEVGHALYTPKKEIEKFLLNENIQNFDILNVVEDIRIERLIKLKYAGMPRIFNGAYKTLSESDFFSIKDKDLSKLNFIDRLNIRGKIGNFVDVPMNKEEDEIYQMCIKAKTFGDVLKIYHLIKDKHEQEEKQKQNENSDGDDSLDKDGESPQKQNDENQSHQNDGTQKRSNQESKNNASKDSDEKKSLLKELDDALAKQLSNGNANKKLMRSETQSAFNKNVLDNSENDIDRNSGDRATEIALWPSQNTIDKLVIPYKTVMASRRFVKSNVNDVEISNYKKNVNNKVSILVREFERRKAAYQYSRSQESRRGTIDVKQIYKYRYDDQIFSSVMQLADAKSHGMVMFVDYSGSMSSTLGNVLDHILNLLHFCKKVNIPFEVYGFTSNIFSNENRFEQSQYEFSMKDFTLSQLFSDKMTKAEYELAYDQVIRQVLSYGYGYHHNDHFSKYEQLGGTPLDHTLIAANHIVNSFNKRTGVQKTNVVILSDGDSHMCLTENMSRRHYNKPMIGTIKTIIGKKQYSIDLCGTSKYRNNRYVTMQLVDILKKSTGSTLICFYIAQGKNASRSMVNLMTNFDYKSSSTLTETYKKEGYAYKAKCLGYDSYFMISNNLQINDEDDFDFSYEKQIDIAEDKSAQNKLAKQFSKHNKKNRQNRIIMTKFAEIIA